MVTVGKRITSRFKPFLILILSFRIRQETQFCYIDWKSYFLVSSHVFSMLVNDTVYFLVFPQSVS